VLQIETEIRKVESAGIEPYRMGTGAIHALLDQIRKFDPNARLDYTGLTYWVESVEVLDGIPIVHLDISKLVQDACDKENES
jgi:acetyl-CoA acetyltransferase